MQGNSFFGFSGGGGGTPPPTSDGWLLNGNANGAEKYFGTNDNFSIPIYTNGSAIGLFSNTGDFGFGTILPTARVHVVGIDATSSSYALKVDDSASSALFYVRNDGASFFNNKSFINYNSSAFQSILQGSTFSTLTDNINILAGISSPASARFRLSYYGNTQWLTALDIQNSGSSFGNLILMPDGGNIGIGIIAPTSKLHVKGIDSISSNYALKVDNSASSPLLYVRNDNNAYFGDASATFNRFMEWNNGSILLNVNANTTSNLQYNTSGELSLTGLNGTGGHNFQFTAIAAKLQNIMRGSSGKRLAFASVSNADMQLSTNGDLYIGLDGVSGVDASARLQVKGIDSTLANYALKVDNSLASPLLYVRNDAKVSIGKATTLTTLDIQGDTTNSLFKLNNSNFLFADKLRVDNIGSFYSGSINGFGAFGTGNFTTDHLNYTFNTSYSTFLAFTNAGGAGNKSSYGIIGGGIGSSDSDYKLVVLNSDAGTLGSVLKVVSTASSLVNDGFDYTSYGLNIISNGVFNNTGAGTFYKVGLNVNISNADINYAALFNGGYVGIGTNAPAASLHVKGIDSTSSNYALKIDNSASSPLLYVRNDGNVYSYGIGSITSNTSFGLDNLLSNTTGDYNTVYGVDAMRSNTIGRINVAIGHSAMKNSTGASDYNVAIGYQALYANGGGTAIVAIGFQSHISNTTGSQNTALGYQTLKLNTTGYNNSAIGHSSLLNNLIGNNNSAYGIETLKNTNADNNTALGASAGRDNVSGTGNVFIGYNAGLNELGSNKLYISNSLTANPLIYGDFGTGLFRINSNSANQDTIGGSVGTINATPNVTAQTISVPTDKVISLESTIVYRKTGGAGVGNVGDGTTIKLNSSVKNIGGTLTIDTIQNTYTGTVNAITGATATYTISGTNVLVSVTGVVNDNITWNVITKVNTVG